MSSHVWCHGPYCHTHQTVDRVRGTKGNKVLRTRKVKVYDNGYAGFYNWFCSQHCYNEFANKYVEQIIRIAPRTEPLETPIHDPKKETIEYSYGNYTRTTITKLDESNDVGQYRTMETKTNNDYTRRNRFTGESIELTEEEAIKHDQIFYHEVLATLEDKTLGTGASKHWDIMRKHLDWFRKNNAKAYMVLLD